MKKVIRLILLAAIANPAFAQLDKMDWTSARIDFRDSTIMADISLDNRFFEGTILIRQKDKVKSYSPQVVASFKVRHPTGKDSIVFESVETHFYRRNGSKKSFLKKTHEGYPFAIYSKFIPDVKSQGFIVPLGSGWVAYGVYRYLRDEEVLFIKVDNQATQFSLPTNRYSKRKRIKIDEQRFYAAMSYRAREVRAFVKKNGLSLNKKKDLPGIIDYANSLGKF